MTGVAAAESNGAYGAGQIIHVQVGFGEPVIVSGTPALTLAVGTARAVPYSGGSSTSTVRFDYVVQAGDSSSDLDYTGTAALSLSGGSITDAAGNAAMLTLTSPSTAGARQRRTW